MVLQIREVLHRPVYVNIRVTSVPSTLEAEFREVFVEGVNPLISPRCFPCTKHQVKNKVPVEKLVRNLELFTIRAVCALYRGISRKGIRAITNGITNERQNEDEVEFVDKKASNERTNEASVIRAVIQERRAILGLANPTDKIPELKKI